MAERWFSDLVRGLSDRASNFPDDTPGELELETAQYLVRAAPVGDGQMLGVSVCFRSADMEALFEHRDVLTVMIRLHQGMVENSDWRFALTDANQPFFVSQLPGPGLTVEQFDALLEDAVNHADIAGRLAQLVAEKGVGEIDPGIVFMMNPA